MEISVVACVLLDALEPAMTNVVSVHKLGLASVICVSKNLSFLAIRGLIIGSQRIKTALKYSLKQLHEVNIGRGDNSETIIGRSTILNSAIVSSSIIVYALSQCSSNANEIVEIIFGKELKDSSDADLVKECDDKDICRNESEVAFQWLERLLGDIDEGVRWAGWVALAGLCSNVDAVRKIFLCPEVNQRFWPVIVGYVFYFILNYMIKLEKTNSVLVTFL